MITVIILNKGLGRKWQDVFQNENFISWYMKKKSVSPKTCYKNPSFQTFINCMSIYKGVLKNSQSLPTIWPNIWFFSFFLVCKDFLVRLSDFPFVVFSRWEVYRFLCLSLLVDQPNESIVLIMHSVRKASLDLFCEYVHGDMQVIQIAWYIYINGKCNEIFWMHSIYYLFIEKLGLFTYISFNRFIRWAQGANYALTDWLIDFIKHHYLLGYLMSNSVQDAQ